VILNPCDDVEAKECVRAAYAHKGPVYLRFGRMPVPAINDPDSYRFQIGKGVQLRDGRDVTIIATGLLVAEAMTAATSLEAQGIKARVVNIHTIKPLDEELVLKCAQDTGVIVTAEEHSVIGGLGEAVCGVVSASCPVPVIRVGVEDTFGYSGPAGQLLGLFGLNAENIEQKVKMAVAQKAR